MTISEAAKFLENAFDVLNGHYFESVLTKAIITIQSSPRAYGHFTQYKAWHDNRDKGGLFEINIGAETLDRPITNTIATLVHEMVHLYCYINEIKDTSRNGIYHNKRFKAEAERRGLIISYDKRIGHSPTQPAPELCAFVKGQKWEDITISRQGSVTAKKPTSTRKYMCPSCGTSVRATKEVNILCGDCNVRMIEATHTKQSVPFLQFKC